MSNSDLRDEVVACGHDPQRMVELMRVAFDARYDGFVHMDLQIILKFANPYAEADLYASDVRFTDAQGVRLMGVGEPADDEFLLDFLSGTLAIGADVRVAISDQSELTMEFPSVDTTLAALPNEEYEGWSARFDPAVADGMTVAVCAPGGEVVYFGPPQ